MAIHTISIFIFHQIISILPSFAIFFPSLTKKFDVSNVKVRKTEMRNWIYPFLYRSFLFIRAKKPRKLYSFEIGIAMNLQKLENVKDFSWFRFRELLLRFGVFFFRWAQSTQAIIWLYAKQRKRRSFALRWSLSLLKESNKISEKLVLINLYCGKLQGKLTRLTKKNGDERWKPHYKKKIAKNNSEILFISFILFVVLSTFPFCSIVQHV